MNTALVIIDMQEGFINENISNLSNKIVDFVKSNKFNLVIGTRYVNNRYTACHKFEGWDGCWEGSDESKLVDSIEDICDVIVTKNKYSCWDDSFISLLGYFEIDKLVFCGVNTGCCVLASAFNAYDDVWDVTIIEDLCASTSGVSSHNAGIQILKECITKKRVITSDKYRR